MENKKKTIKDYIAIYWMQITLFIILIFWWMKCREISWWFWIIFIILEVAWMRDKNKRNKLEKQVH